MRVGEVLEVHPQAAVVPDLKEMIFDGLDVSRLAVGSEPHDLVFAGIHREAGEIGESRVEQPERVRKPHLPQDLERVAASHADGRRCPFPDPVDGDDRRVFER